MKTILLALGLIALSGAWAAQGPPKQPAAQVAVTAAEDESTHADAAEWQRWNVAVVRALSASAKPRDWALAAQSYAADPSSAPDSDAIRRHELLQRAAEGAPEDALVQWLAALDGRVAAETGEASAVTALIRLEPDNAASWLLALGAAARSGDADGVGEALARMAASTRYDDHFADTLRAWIAVYDAYPLPTPADARTSAGSAEVSAFVVAMAKAMATALPAYADLLHACRPLQDQPPATARAADCETAGRLLLNHGSTLVARSMGLALLRSDPGKPMSAADAAAGRNLAWIKQEGARILGADQNAAAMRAYAADWRDFDDEVVVISRALRRAGVSSDAPAGWDPTKPHAT